MLEGRTCVNALRVNIIAGKYVHDHEAADPTRMQDRAIMTDAINASSVSFSESQAPSITCGCKNSCQSCENNSLATRSR